MGDFKVVPELLVLRAQLGDLLVGQLETAPQRAVAGAASARPTGRVTAGDQLRQGTARLAYLKALPVFTAADMCSERAWLMAWHATGVTFCLVTGVLSEPCPPWPVWNAKITAGFARVAQMMQQKQKTPVSERTARLLAAIAEGSSVEDVIVPLTQVRATNPVKVKPEFYGTSSPSLPRTPAPGG